MGPSFARRFQALLIDYLVILAWMGILFVAAYTWFAAVGRFPDYLGMFGPIGAQAIFFFLLTLPVGLYLYSTEASVHHATIGKRKLGLAVASAKGGAPRRRHIAVRTIVKLLPWEIAHTFVWQLQYFLYKHGYETQPPVWILVGLSGAVFLAAIYVAMVALRRDGRGPHDLAAHTKVLSR